MRDYGKMFLGLIMAGVALIVIGLWLVNHRVRNDNTEARPALSSSLVQAGPGLSAEPKNY